MKLRFLLAPVLLAACADGSPPAADGGVEALSALTHFEITTADRCQITRLTCSEAEVTCSDLPDEREVVDQWRRVHPVDDTGSGRYTIPSPWTGQYVTAICPAGLRADLDANVAPCEMEIDTITLPADCEQRTWPSTTTPMPIPAQTPAVSPLNVAAPAVRRAMIVDVDIAHPNRRDLRVALEAVGARTVLHDGAGAAAPNLRRRYFLPSVRGSNGPWRLVVEDAAATGGGTLRGWSMRPASQCRSYLACDAGLGQYCPTWTRSNHRRPVSEAVVVEDTLALATPGVAGAVTLELDLDHARSSDLEISLRAPSGEVARVWERQGGSAPFAPRSFELGQLAGARRDGTWTLILRDRATNAVGTLHGWTLRTQPLCL